LRASSSSKIAARAGSANTITAAATAACHDHQRRGNITGIRRHEKRARHWFRCLQLGLEAAPPLPRNDGDSHRNLRTRRDACQRLEGNEKALKACPDVKVLEKQTANWSRAEAQTLMENWLTSHPGQINGVIGQNDEMALGAIEAIKAANLKVEDFAIAGVDGVTDAINAVKRGAMASILQDANAQAQGALDVAIKAANKDAKPESAIWTQYPDMKWEEGASKDYLVPWTPVTKENADKLLESRK